MTKFFIDADSVFDQHIHGLLHTDSSSQRVLSRFLSWMDETVASTKPSEIVIVSENLEALTSSSNTMESTYGQLLKLWGQKHTAKLLETRSKRVLDAIHGLSRSSVATIVSSDTRVAQLLSDDVSLLKPESTDAYTITRLLSDTGGLTPSQLPLLLSLIGVPEYNVKAIAGMSNSLEIVLRSDKTIEGVVALARKQSGFDFQQIAANLDLIKKNIQSTYARPLNVQPEHFSVLSDPLAQSKLEALLAKAPKSPRASALPSYPMTVRNLTTVEDFSWARSLLEKAPAYSINFEKDSSGIFAASISLKDGFCLYIPFDTHNGQIQPKSTVIDFIKETMTQKGSLICFSAKELSSDLESLNINHYEIKADCACAEYLLDSSVMIEDASDLYKDPDTSLPRMIDFCNRDGHGLAQNIGIDRCAILAGVRSDLIWQTSKKVFSKILSKNLKDQYQKFEIPQSVICAKMGRTGIRIDIDRLKSIKSIASQKLESAKSSILDSTGLKVDVTSTSDLNTLLDTIKVSTGNTASGMRALNEEALQNAKHKHPVIQYIIAGREAAQTISGGSDKLLRWTDQEGILRFNPFTNSTDTGRLSIRDPDLQNSTAEMRGCMIAEAGYTVACYDYSQMELRILAHLSGEPKLIRAFAENKDVHAETAAEVFGVGAAEVTEDQRKAAKAINFGLIYGISAGGLSKKLGVSFQKAQTYIDAYFEKMPLVRKFQNELIASVREKGTYTLENGRDFAFPNINSSDKTIKNKEERKVLNAPMQATAAEVVKRAMILCEQNLKCEGIDARLMLQVHDELIFQVKTEQLKKADAIILNAMKTAYPLAVPLDIESSFGRSLNKKLNTGNELITHYPLTI